jgi:patatin-like phospholipase/acyl hydrolase
MAERVRVLSIDGGGIRGIIPAVALADLEERAGRPVSELFDLIAGTSTGGILALALTRPGPDGRPAWSAAKLVELYEQEGPHIFSRPLGQTIRSVGGLIDEKYPSGGLEAALERYLGQTRLSEALADVLVTAYDTERRRPFFFKSAAARTEPGRDFPMAGAARSTAAAPTYFEPYRLEAQPPAEYFSLVDGGVFATNPAMCAFAEVARHHPGAEVVLLSLGTGQLTRSLPYDEVKDWGLVEWARPILDVVFDGVSDTVDYQLDQLLGDGRYWRLQVALDGGASDDLDNAGADNLRLLKLKGEEMVEASRRQLDEALAAIAPAT